MYKEYRCDEKKTLKKASKTSQGVSVVPKMGFKPQKEYRPVTKKPNASSSVDNDGEFGTNGGTNNLINNEATSSGSSFMNIDNDGEFASNTPIGAKIKKIKRQIGEGKLRLLDNDDKQLVPTGIVESDSEVGVVFDETANLRIPMSGKDRSDKENSVYLVEQCGSKVVPIRSSTRIRAGLEEHLSPMELPNKISIGIGTGLGRGLLIGFGDGGWSSRPIAVPNVATMAAQPRNVSDLSWAFAIEALSYSQEVDVNTLIDTFNSSSKFTSDAGCNAREMVSFRILERLFDPYTRRLKSVGRKSEVSFNFSKCCEDVLEHILMEAGWYKGELIKVSMELMREFFTGDVLDSFTKSINLSVSYDDREVSNGCELKPSQIVNQPRVDIGGDDMRVFHTLVMVDPDAPSPSNPNIGEYLHWLVTNIPATTGARFGQEIVCYESPRPSMGIHRMVFVLFR
nr:FT like protein [Tanacetum cinerariifolium]